MATVVNKRALPAKIQRMKANKKRKLSGDVGASQKNNLIRNKSSKGKLVKLDDLKWNEVSAPDHLDDYEGFFGLEEIDDVDVVRDGDTLSYRHVDNVSSQHEVAVVDSDSHAAHEIEQNGVSSDDQDAPPVSSVESASEQEDWSGFESEDNEADSQSSPKVAVAKKKSKSQSSEKTPTGHLQDDEDDDLSGKTGFEILQNREEEDDLVADVTEWEKLSLSEEVLSCLSKLKFTAPTAIQSQAIPQILQGYDLIGKAPTGSGKTVAFGVPILESWLASQRVTKKVELSETKAPIALILLPTRELAHQIDARLAALCSNTSQTSPRIATLTGGLSIQKQRRILGQADIIVATPGRLWEVISEGRGVLESIRQIQFLVLDEADRLLNEGHFKELSEILDALDRKTFSETGEESSTSSTKANLLSRTRQTLVFSATFAASLHRKLSKQNSRPQNDLLSNEASMEYLLRKLNFQDASPPKFVDVNPTHQLVSTLREGILECPSGTEKDLYLYALTLLHRQSRTLVFVNSISAVRRLVPFLQNLNIPAQPLHSQMAQKARLRSVERFSSDGVKYTPQTNGSKQAKSATATTQMKNTAPVLIATDVAARGLDIPNVHLVIHYHLPRTADTYVHRSGRTARASASGSSILLCAPEEVSGVRRLVSQVHSASNGGKARKSKAAGNMRSLDLDRKIVDRLKPRAVIAKKLADAAMAKEKQASSDSFFREAAEDLGIDYDSDEFAAEEAKMMGRKARGAGRKKKQKEAREMSKEELGRLRAELRELLSRRINVGVSERYLAGGRGGVDLSKLVEEMEGNGGRGEFLGLVPDLGFEV